MYIYICIAMNKYMYAAYINMIIHDLPWSYMDDII